MNDKTVSKHLINLEKNFASDNPVLLNATKAFHELDQLEYELGLLGEDDTTASKNTWWPVISVISSHASAKTKFINEYFASDTLLSGIQSAINKFTVLQHSNQPNSVTLPGTALDVDQRFPFYQISKKIEQKKAGEGERINSYLELKTVTNPRLKGKLFIDTPPVEFALANPVSNLLTQYSIEVSDLILVFTDIFNSDPHLINELTQHIIAHQDSNKFVYLIDQTNAELTPSNGAELVTNWQRRLAELGLNTGQFIILDKQNQSGFSEIDQRLANVDHDRSYRVLNSLDHSIREIGEVIMPEITEGISVWKDRCNFSTLLILGFIVTLMLFAEINIGFFAFFLDPIIGPLIIITLTTVMVPLHLLISKVQAKFIVKRLDDRQKELHILENLSEIFEKSLTPWRMLLPITTPVGWNKATKARLAQLSDKAKGLVQTLNDNFTTYNAIVTNDEPVSAPQPSVLDPELPGAFSSQSGFDN